MQKLTAPFILVSLTLTACGEGSAIDESFKAGYREKAVATCTSAASGYVPESANVDIDKICGCAADKIMEGKSATDLATTVPGSAEDIANIRKCATELYPDGVKITL